MREELEQAVAGHDPLELVPPERAVPVAEEAKQRVVLRGGVRQLHDIAVEEGPRGGGPARNGLVGIGVRHCAVIGEWKLSKPLDYAMRGGRAEADSAKAFSGLAQQRELALELVAGCEQGAGVMDPSRNDIMPSALQMVHLAHVDRVQVAHDVKGGSEAVVLLPFGDDRSARAAV